MDEVFVYWDNSNIVHEMQRLAEERNEGPDARYRVRIQFDNLLRLVHADRPARKAFAAGSIPGALEPDGGSRRGGRAVRSRPTRPW